VTEFEQVPLTLEDVLHPQEGDSSTHSLEHGRRNYYLYDVFLARLADDPMAVVLHDVRIAWDLPGLGAHGPDIAVIFGVRERKNWSTFDVAREGVRPSLIVEVTSPETARIDRSDKLEEYSLARVPLYVIIDTLTSGGRSQLLLLGYIQGPSGYQVLAPNERGWLWLDPVRVWLGIADDEIVCYNEAGEPLGDYRALTATLNTEIAARVAAEQQALAEAEARVTAEQRATAAEQRAASAEAQLQALEAELRRLRGDAS
jgi:Uma2 family endonuclease